MERYWRFLLAGFVVLFPTVISFASDGPANLRVDGVPRNERVLGPTPMFCWDFETAQSNWQIQVDDDPEFRPNEQGPNEKGMARGVWFWDSGKGEKRGAEADRCARMRSVTRAGAASRSLDARPHSIYWRVRVQKPGGEWTPWTASALRMNQPPSMPAQIAVHEQPVPSAGPGSVAIPFEGRTWVVSPSGNDDADGTVERPYRTLTRGVASLRAGDTLLVREGIYRESLSLSSRSGHSSGGPGEPITVMAYPGESPVLRGDSVGRGAALRMGPQAGLSHWVFDGLRIGGPGAATGISLSGARSVTISNCRLEKGLPRQAAGISIDGGSGEIVVAGCTFDQPVAAQIEVGSAGRVEVRGNLFSRFDGGHAVRKRGEETGAILIADNRFEDAAPKTAAVVLAKGATGSQVVSNVFAGIGRSGRGDAVVVYRAGDVTVEGNVFHEVAGAGLRVNEMSQFGTYRNNIFTRCGTGLHFKGGIVDGSSSLGASVDFNFFHGNGVDIGGDPRALDHLAAPSTGNCAGDSACDPQYVDAAAGDFRLRATSPAIDAGHPASPVPIGGGGRIDVGRFEAGAGSPPYRFEPAYRVSDPTPRFTWRLVDTDNRLAGGAEDHQSRFQIQIDSSPAFDSHAGGALFDSGVVASGVEEFTLPEGAALAPGLYYVRVRQWDGAGHAPGAWSPHNLGFEVAGPAMASRGGGR